ncbi:hypothetical protein SLS60_001193 [Paraconiothyrium brasiliense]|uniref:Protein kinase domain-containing protein n=1 Tax=Paraconiothyrium brasiliense TaxID=300254 RepID=A0ABR3S8E1_9PLEO
MRANNTNESMFSRLEKALVGCSLNNEQRFLPLDVLEKEITEDNVRSVLSKGVVVKAALSTKSLIRALPRTVEERARKVFAILLGVGEPDAIKKLLAEGLTDERLPVHLDKDGRTLVSRDGTVFRSLASIREERIVHFVERQWTVLAPSLDASGQHIEINRRCPLPFVETTPIGHGPTSAVHKSKLHPAHYCGPHLFANMEYVATKEMWKEDVFLQEKENLRTLALLKHDHLIRHMATFTKNTTHYVIFPWADGGTLADFWTFQNTCVRDRVLTIWCLRQMLGVAEAIEALHSVNCRHGDMKPENILHFTGPDGGRLVVSDVGVSRTHDKATRLRQVGTTTRATTPSYEAPETLASQFSPRARRYDVWSIGCIFLEFSLWILHDMASVDSFGYARHAPDYAFYLTNRETSTSRRRTEIHPVVTTALRLLRQDDRCKGGTIFEDVLTLIETRLLQVEVDQRATATEMVEQLRTIVQHADADPARLLNDVAPPEKLRFPKRAQTGGTTVSINGTIHE